MERFRGKRPSPAMVVSLIALVFALAGSAAAGVATISALTKKEKAQTRNIADTEINKLAAGLSVRSAGTAGSAGNSDTLGGIGANGFVRGSGRLVPVRGYVAVGAVKTLLDVSGVGRLDVACGNSGQDVTVLYVNLSGASQMVSRSTVHQGPSQLVELGGQVLPNNGTTQGTGSSASDTQAHLYTFDAGPAAETGAPGFSFRGTAFTRLNGTARCALTGVAAIG